MSERDVYVEKLKVRLDQWNAEMDKLEAKTREASVEARGQFEKQMDELREHQRAAEERLKTLQRANEQAWEDMKSGAEQMWKSFADAMAKARSRYP